MTYIAAIGICLIFMVFVITGYNHGVRLRNYVRDAFSTMDVYLKKRWDLIPNLVETVKGYVEHEKGLLESLTATRAKNYSSMSNEEKLEVNMKIGSVLPKLLAVAEGYPDLKASQNFLKLMDDLGKVEEDIANSRKYYNGTVRELNTFTELFPSNIICGIFGIKSEKFFEAEDKERENVKVQF